MNYSNYTIQDFVLDQDFRRWVENPDSESNQFWNQWLQDHPDRYEDVQQARRLILHLDFEEEKLKPAEREMVWDGILAGIESSQDKKPSSKQRYLFQDRPQKSYRSSKKKWNIAAVITLLIGASVFLLLWQWESAPKKYAIQTNFGETKSLVLRDGSKVFLNANSTIKYTSDWGEANDRQVWIEGEAYFDVMHKENNQRFIVNVGDAKIEVLGTEFNVFNREAETSVVLTEGKIEFRTDQSESVELIPGELLAYNASSSKLKKETVTTEEYTSWKENKLVFRRKTLEEVSTLLKYNYDIDVFFIDEELADKHFTGVIPSDNLEILIESLAKAFDLDIERKGNVLIMKYKE